MKTLDRYLWRHLWRLFLFLTLIFLLLFDLFELLNQLDQIGRGSYTLSKALIFVFLTSGNKLLDLLPIITFLAILLGLGQLLDRNELLALEALGYSKRRLFVTVILALLSWSLPLWGISETGLKRVEEKAWQLKTKALSQESLTLYGEGFWARQGEVFLKVKKVLDDGLLSGIEIFRFEGERLREYLSAPLGKITPGRWILWKARQRILYNSRVEDKLWDRLFIDPPLPGREVENFALPVEFLPLPELFRYSETLAAGGQNVYRYQLAIWQKIVTPLLSLVMGLLALSFYQNPLARQKSFLTRLGAGLAGGLAVYLLRETLAHAGRVFSLPAPLVAFAPVALILLLAFVRWKKKG